jgi:hypothetical protein
MKEWNKKHEGNKRWIPIVKRFEGVDLAVVSGSDKNIYREIDEAMKKESASRRDER